MFVVVHSSRVAVFRGGGVWRQNRRVASKLKGPGFGRGGKKLCLVG